MYQRVYRPRNTHTPNEEVANNSSGHGTLQKPNPHTSAEHTRVPKAGRTDTQGTPRHFGSPLPPLALGPLRAPHHVARPPVCPTGVPRRAQHRTRRHNRTAPAASLAWASAAAAAMAARPQRTARPGLPRPPLILLSATPPRAAPLAQPASHRSGAPIGRPAVGPLCGKWRLAEPGRQRLPPRECVSPAVSMAPPATEQRRA